MPPRALSLIATHCHELPRSVTTCESLGDANRTPHANPAKCMRSVSPNRMPIAHAGRLPATQVLHAIPGPVRVQVSAQLGVHQVRASTLASTLIAIDGHRLPWIANRLPIDCQYIALPWIASFIRYANKFKSLLLCGSVVLYIREGMRHKVRDGR